MDWMWNALWSLLPTVSILVVFVIVMRSILGADRRERRAYAEIEAEERAKRGLPPKTPTE